MKWNYRCPKCKAEVVVEWAKRESRFICPGCKQAHSPPPPEAQPTAYVDDRRWPVEMEQAVVSVKGNVCTVPGCDARYQTLDHRIPWTQGGRTSVENLWPMCNEHNQQKGDTNYAVWLLHLLKEATAGG